MAKEERKEKTSETLRELQSQQKLLEDLLKKVNSAASDINLLLFLPEEEANEKLDPVIFKTMDNPQLWIAGSIAELSLGIEKARKVLEKSLKKSLTIFSDLGQ